MKIYENISYNKTDINTCLLDVYLPDAECFPVFIYFHGGGLEGGDKSDMKEIYEGLVKRGIAVVCANYRKYPDATFPDYIIDAAAAVAWAYENMNSYGKITGFFIGGSSAGAYLSEMLCFDRKYLANHNIDADNVTGYVYDAAQPTTHFNILRERGLDTRRVIIDEAAPLYHIAADRNYPPMQILVSDNGMPNCFEQTKLLVSTLKNFGYDNKIDFRVVDNSTHCSYNYLQNDRGEWFFADIIYEFIQKNDINWRKK